MLRPLFKKTYKVDEAAGTKAKEEPSVPQGLWRKCNKCGHPIYVDDVIANYWICPKCGGYFRIHARRRLEMLVDEGTFIEWNEKMDFVNPLDFPGYEKKIHAAQEKSGLDEAIVTGYGRIGGQAAAIGVCDARFMMSSMGHNVGEKITQMVERATEQKLPVIIFACSGGARMQEGLVSLMQMAKTSAALKRHHDAGQLFISVLTDPTTGGVTASFAMLGDIIIAEPGALIGFAGPRVIEQTIGQKLPEGFQRAEFLLEHGFVDMIVERDQQKEVLTRILKLHAPAQAADDIKAEGAQNSTEENISGVDNIGENVKHGGLHKKHTDVTAQIKSAWDTVVLSRKADRPVASDYIHAVFDDFTEFHGDRYFGDDGAIVGGIASFHGIPVTVIGQEKGKNTKDNIKRNFGMPSPEGYRKALRLMKQAETFHRPIICFVDTPGAFCGLEAEERGQGEAIARNLYEMAALTVPVLSIVIGEGGSGGALAMAVANEVWMLENATYSILSPEGFASILWKDSKRAADAARVMKITAADLKKLGMIERIITEEEPACANNLKALAGQIRSGLQEFLDQFVPMDGDKVRDLRYDRFRKF
jgi:acetyl-CoA carboxylase carboxyl transferase subunit beta